MKWKGLVGEGTRALAFLNGDSISSPSPENQQHVFPHRPDKEAKNRTPPFLSPLFLSFSDPAPKLEVAGAHSKLTRGGVGGWGGKVLPPSRSSGKCHDRPS